MRHFIVTGHAAPTEPFFNLDDLPGNGRLDLLCRAVNAALLTSHGIRGNVVLDVVLRDTYTVRFNGEELGGLNPDTRSIAGMFQNALTQPPTEPGGTAMVSHGVTITRRGFEDLVQAADAPVVWLHRSGDRFAARKREMFQDAVFVLSDHRDFTAAEQKVLTEADAVKLSLGGVPLHTDHSIAVVHNYLDAAKV